MQTTSRLTPEIWLNDLVLSKAREIERFAGMERFMSKVDRRGYQVAKTEFFSRTRHDRWAR